MSVVNDEDADALVPEGDVHRVEVDAVGVLATCILVLMREIECLDLVSPRVQEPEPKVTGIIIQPPEEGGTAEVGGLSHTDSL